MKKIALWSCLAIIFVLAVFNGVLAFGGSEEAAFVAAVVAFTAAVAATVFTFVGELKLSVWRVLPTYLIEVIAIFGSLYFFQSIGWWSAGIGLVGIALILAFWQGCEWYDRRHPKPIIDTLHGDKQIARHSTM